MKETKARSMAKSISWRAVAILSTLIIIYIFTGEIYLSGIVTIIGAVSGLFLHYTHERIWVKYIKWGYIDE